MRVPLSRSSTVAICAGLVTIFSQAGAAELPAGLLSEMAGPSFDLPSLSRLAIGVLGAIGAAVLAILLLRTALLRVQPAVAGGLEVRIVGRLAVSRSLTVHTLKIGDATVVIAEGKDGVSAVELDTAHAVSQSARPV